MTNTIRERNFIPELEFTASRSSGAGGQNVNKVNTKVELRFHVDNSAVLNEDEKKQIKEKLANFISGEGYLILQSQKERSQLRNKETVIEKFYKLIEKALLPVRQRVKTNPTKVSQEKRLELKKKKAVLKSLRQQKYNLD